MLFLEMGLQAATVLRLLYLIEPNLLTVDGKSLPRVSGTQRSLFPESEIRDCCMATVTDVLAEGPVSAQDGDTWNLGLPSGRGCLV